MVFMDLKKKKKSFETKIHGFIFFINLFWVEHLNLEKGNFKGEELKLKPLCFSKESFHVFRKKIPQNKNQNHLRRVSMVLMETTVFIHFLCKEKEPNKILKIKGLKNTHLEEAFF